MRGDGLIQYTAQWGKKGAEVIESNNVAHHVLAFVAHVLLLKLGLELHCLTPGALGTHQGDQQVPAARRCWIKTCE